MECNKDEAARAKEIAENKFLANDFVGAKKFANKAQNLFPGLEGISQFLAMLDVYIAAENNIYGELDWYGILGIQNAADDDTIKKQYRKLALTLHPDKNKSIGADGAFKFISQAWSLLSDKEKKMAYDRKRNTRFCQPSSGFSPSGPGPGPVPVPPYGQNGSSNSSSAPQAPKVPKKVPKFPKVPRAPKGSSTSRAPPSNVPVSPIKESPNTFWTKCHICKTLHQYMRIYADKNLLCSICRLPFFSVEVPPPLLNVPQKRDQKNSNSPNGGPVASSQNFQWTPFVNKPGAATAAQAANLVQKAYDKVKKDREEAQAATKREQALKKKEAAEAQAALKRQEALKRKNDNAEKRSDAAKKKKVSEENANKPDSVEQSKASGSSKPNVKIQHILVEKAKTEIRKKLHEWDSITPDQKIKKMSMYVPDSDFHDFDSERMENCFEENQVWAAFDDDDGMPRYYARIHEVISLNPFKLKISWLYPNTDNKNQIVSDTTKTCGDFKIGKSEINDSINSFSHKVKWTKGPQGSFLVYPKKGDVWALYRNWSPEWNHLTPGEVKHKYDVVEVLEDFDEEQGITVTPLVKVAGFKTVFHEHLDAGEVKRIPREELFRFSHFIPSYSLTGQENPNEPKGCIELDPAGTPYELLQSVTDGSKNVEYMEI